MSDEYLTLCSEELDLGDARVLWKSAMVGKRQVWMSYERGRVHTRVVEPGEGSRCVLKMRLPEGTYNVLEGRWVSVLEGDTVHLLDLSAEDIPVTTLRTRAVSLGGGAGARTVTMTWSAAQ